MNVWFAGRLVPAPSAGLEQERDPRAKDDPELVLQLH